MPFFALLALSVGLMVVGYLMMPKQKTPEVQAQDFDAPGAKAHVPMVIVFGTKKVKSVNCLFVGEKSTLKRKV